MRTREETMHKTYIRQGILYALCVLVIDQLSKGWLIDKVGMDGAPHVLTPFFNLVMVWNHGISFGIFAGHGEANPWPLILATSVIAGVLMKWLLQADRMALASALGLVIGGALGNIIDRVRFGAVADFFDFHFMGYHWPAFNVADSAICIGVAILCWESIVHPVKSSDTTPS